ASPVIEAASTDVAYAISTIFLFNIAAVLLFPLVGHLLGMSQHAFGLFAGTAVNDTSSVVAAATSYGNQATNYAVVVKLTRSLMIIPICLGLAGWAARRERRAEGTRAAQSTGSDAPAGDGGGSRVRIGKLVPWFLVGFVLVAAINSLGLIPQAAHGALTGTASFLITIALAGIGLSIDIRGLRRTGPRPLLLGALLWIAVSTTSLGMQWLLGVHG
ncbi:MAG: YeiH family protein, partial [Sciscionella sp.]